MLSASNADSIASTLDYIDPILKSAIAQIRLAINEAIPVRQYDVCTQHHKLIALEFNYQDTLVYNLTTNQTDIFSNLQLAFESYPYPFVFTASQIGKTMRNKIMRHEEVGLGNTDMRILYLASRGFTNKYIALDMKLAVSTIKNRLTRLYKILRVNSRQEAIVFIHDSGILANFRLENNDI